MTTDSRHVLGFLGWLVAYPRSVAASLLAPRGLLEHTKGSRYCPPAAAFAISLLLYWLGGSLVHRVELGARGSIDFPSLGVVVGTVTWILLVLVAIRGTFARVFKLAHESPLASLRQLTWPASVGLSAYAALVFLATLFPQATVTIAGLLDSGIARLPDTWTVPMIWTHAVDTASALPVLALFAWSLFNVARTGFGAARGRAALATAAAVVIGLVVSGLYLEFSGRITRQVFLWTAG